MHADLGPRITALGRLRIEGVDARLVRRWKLLAMLVYLARRGRTDATRDELIAVFWGTRPGDRARRSLNQALVELRACLGPGLISEGETIQLAPGSIRLDVDEFEDALRNRDVELATGLWGGSFLEGGEDLGSADYRTWIERERTALRVRFAGLLAEACEDAERRGEWHDVVRFAAIWSEIEPADERPILPLIRALRRTGRPDEARVRVENFRAALKELGIDPPAMFETMAENLLRGRPDPVRGRTRSIAVLSPDFVARGEVLSELRAACTDMIAGTPVVVVQGDAGMGKTRLVDEFVRFLSGEPSGCFVLRANACEIVPAELGVISALLTGLRRAPGLSGASEADLGELSQLVPAIRERFAELPPPSGDALARRRACSRTLADVAAEVPLLLVIDDFDHADRDSRAELLALASASSHAGILVLVTCTSTVPESQRLQSLPGARHISLKPLDRPAIQDMVESMLGDPADSLRTALDALHAETGGNPFFVGEIVRDLVDSGHLACDASGHWTLDPVPGPTGYPLPLSIRQAIRRRLDALDPPTRRVLANIAVRIVADHNELLADSGVDAQQLRDEVDQLIERRLVRQAGPGLAGYVVTHDLIRRVVIEEYAADEAGAPSPRRSGHQRTTLRRAAGAAAVGLTAAGIAGFLSLAWPSGNQPASNVIAVFPFEILGEPEIEYLGRGLVDLISFDLDRAGDVIAVTPRSVLTALAQNPHLPEETIARSLGAGRHVTGTVVQQGGRLRITAYLVDTDGRGEPVAVSAEGPATRVFELADEVSARLLGASQAGPHGAIARQAAALTSLVAYRSYLIGEEHYRSGRFGDAVAAFQDAVAADSSFALGYYRLATAAEWVVGDSLALWAARRAFTFADGLPPSTRRLLRAFLAWREGDADTAERLYSEMVFEFREDPEAWYNLAEVLFHLNPVRGRSISEARLPFERLLDREPRNGTATWHLARLAVLARDSTWWQDLVRRSGVRRPDPLWELGLGGALAHDTVLAHWRAEESMDLVVNTVRTAVYSGNLDAAATLAGFLRLPERTSSERETGLLYGGLLAIAAGRTAEGWALLERMDSVEALPYQALIAATPGIAMGPETLRRIQERLSTWRPQAPLRADMYAEPVPPSVAALLRPYMQARIGIALDESTAIDAALAELERMTLDDGTLDSLRRVFLSGIRAGRAFRHGRMGDVLVELGDEINPVPPNLTHIVVGSQAYERFIRARALQEQGRLDEAAAWYRSLRENALFDLVYLVPTRPFETQLAEVTGVAGGGI